MITERDKSAAKTNLAEGTRTKQEITLFLLLADVTGKTYEEIENSYYEAQKTLVEIFQSIK